MLTRFTQPRTLLRDDLTVSFTQSQQFFCTCRAHFFLHLFPFSLTRVASTSVWNYNFLVSLRGLEQFNHFFLILQLFLSLTCEQPPTYELGVRMVDTRRSATGHRKTSTATQRTDERRKSSDSVGLSHPSPKTEKKMPSTSNILFHGTNWSKKKNYTRLFLFFPPYYMLRLSAIALLFTATQLLLTMAAQQKILLPFTFFSSSSLKIVHQVRTLFNYTHFIYLSYHFFFSFLSLAWLTMLPAAALRTLCNSFLQLDRCCVVIFCEHESRHSRLQIANTLFRRRRCVLDVESIWCLLWFQNVDMERPDIEFQSTKKAERERRKRQNTGKMSSTRSESRETFVIQFKLRLTTRHGVISDERSIVCGEFCTRYAVAACDK